MLCNTCVPCILTHGHVYIIMYTVVIIGERCNYCLRQHISPNTSDICVDDTFNITITTSQSQPHGSPFTLLINRNTCSSDGGGSGIVTCREQSGDILQQTTFSYYVTAVHNGTVNIQGHTTYYGAEWFSNIIEVTISDCDNRESEYYNIIKWLS